MSKVLKAIADYAQRTPDNIALSDGNENITYHQLAEFIRMSELLAAMLQEDCIAVQMDNSIAWVLLDLITIELGITSIPIPPFFTEQQKQHALKSGGAKLLVTDRKIESSYQLEIAGKTLYLYRLYNEARRPENTAKITYTSGTTGTPKGIYLSQDGMENVAASLVEVIGKQAAARHMAVLPLAILLENIGGVYATLLSGGCYVVKSLSEIGFAQTFQPDFKQLASQMNAENATSCILVPELLKGLVYTQASLNSMKFMAVGGARLADDILEKAEVLKLPVYQGYGLSESASVVAVNTPSANKPGSVGRILPHIKFHIAEDGELILLHPASLAHQDAEYPTGDICHIDEQGYLFVDGRKKNVLINSFGRNVSPEWVESEIASSPLIGQVYVYGDGEPALSALIVPSASHLNREQLAVAVNAANSRLPEYAQVRNWQVVAPFTIQNNMLTGTGRLRRAEINKTYQLNREKENVAFL